MSGFNSNFRTAVVESGTGGNSNDPTYPSSPVTFDNLTSTQTLTLTNTGTTPASVELSFSSLSGGKTLLIGQDYDQGTDTSPTYVVDPDTGTRTVTLNRGALSPSSPSSMEVVTLTSNAGTLPQTITCTLEPLSQVHSIIRAFAAPTIPSYEFKYDGNFVNTGVIGGTSAASSMTATSDTSTYPGFVGYGETTANGSHHDINNVNHSTTLRNTNRSWIFAFHIVTETGGYRVSLLHGTNARSGPGWLQTQGTNFRFTYVANSSSASVLNLDATHNHTDGGASVACTRSNGTTILVCASYDASAGTTTYRWKKSGDRAGHSYKVVSGIAGQTASGASKCTFVGYSSNTYYVVRHLNTTIVDTLVGVDNFNDIANAMNL